MLDSLVHLKRKRVCVIGDFMLDSYTKGSVKRISPEAPVCVLKVKKQQKLPGGAGNVALNCRSLGADVYVVGRVGEDFESQYLKNSLSQAQINTDGLILEGDYETPLKNRFLAEHQQLLRVDFEKDQPVKDETVHEIINYLRSQLPHIDLVLISDYNKGLLSRPLLSAIITLCNSQNVPVFVDPKGHDFSKYLGATLIKPNLQEAYHAAGMDEKASLDDVAKSLLGISKADYLLITRSEKGMSLFTDGQRCDLAACAKEVMDVTGAGDTVLATLAVAYASGIDLLICMQFANVAASCAIEKLGCVQVGKKELVKAIARNDTRFKYLPHMAEDIVPMLYEGEKMKCFEIDHQSLDFRLLAEFSKAKEQYPDHLIAAIIPDQSHQDIIQSLCDLVPVDLVVPKSLKDLIKDFLADDQLIQV